MWKQIRAALVVLLGMTAITGIAYPLAVTGLGQLLFPDQANGSLLRRDGKVIGSELIGQNFSAEKYFWGRPSATADTDPNDLREAAEAFSGTAIQPRYKPWFGGQALPDAGAAKPKKP